MPQTETTGPGSVLAQIANEMVRLFKEQFGRGPTRARASWAGDDILVVVLEDTLTSAERNLVLMGEHERLRETRLFFQTATEREFCEPVQRLTGRKIRAFMSALDTLADGLAMEMFVFYPVGEEEGKPSRAEIAVSPSRAAGS
ncbi:MAG TPA: Na-translocating system protein MpsC family protein [Conexibacter sp.]|nr:Na-translocating system protein MpsC family protein [Conexibacter sp.]